ncbi:MAG: AraC family transcriptional regulator, partial [Spirochaetaceae bacterium]|nr:AraC family transcriptional regulator [Spirochaetaceae bacterium]
VLVFFFSLIVLQGTMYLVDRKIWIRLINVLFLVYHMSVYFIFFTTKDLFSGNHQLWIDFSFTYVYLGTTVLLLFLIVLFQSLYRISLSHLNRIYIPATLLGALGLLFTSGDIFAQIIIQAIIIIIGFIALIYMLYLLNRIKPNPFLIRVIIIEIVLFSITILWGTMGGILELGFRPPDGLPLFLSIIYIFLAFLYEAMLAKKQRDRVNLLYRKLKSTGITAKKAEPQITSTSEEKLETVLNFIKQNYTSDLSREGLAAAVDMNTSYFSTLFNTYTGKKINEYIHSLRIKDAIILLESSDDKIIEIAFSVGFESLATFNRAFKHETGSTPTEYKRSIELC